MIQFAKWFIDFFKENLKDIGIAIKNFFVGIYNLLIGNPINYFKNFFTASRSFGFLDWVMAILAIILVLALYIGIIYLIVILLRKYVRFVKKEKDKETLMHEAALLSEKVSNLIDEKNAVIALSGPLAPGQNNKRNGVNDSDVKKRFVKLCKVDEDYNFEIRQTVMGSEDLITLKQMVERFINFAASQLHLYYNPHIVASFFAGMASSKTIILEGISGTGKTSLPYAMGKFFKNDTHIISVQPSWRDRAEMMGYLNEFTKKFNETDFLKSVYETTYRTDINLVVLDEMNLARVEYYFADFLSLLEMPNPSEWQLDLVPDQLPGDPLHLQDGKILISQNIWFIGTANKDDSTFTITDKVYDRAASIEMNTKADVINAPLTNGITMNFDYLNKLFTEAVTEYKISDKSMEAICKLDEFITEKFQVTFGNRIMKQIQIFVPVYKACGGDELTGLDHIFARKILRKFESLNLPFLQQEIEELITLLEKMFGKQNFLQSKNMLHNYLKQI